MILSTHNHNIHPSSELPKNENKEETLVQINNLPIDVWNIIFNHLKFDDWAKLLYMNRTFKLICENPAIMNFLLEKRKFIPNTKKANFAIKLGRHLIKLNLNTLSLTEQKFMEIFVACTHLQELSLLNENKSVKRGLLSKTIQSVYSFATSFWSPVNQQKTLTTQHCRHLTQLYLANFPFREQTLIEILAASLNLIKLSLRGCQLTDEILKNLPKTLQSLNLSYSKMTDQNLQLLQQLVNLRFLELSFCEKITDDGLKHLKELDSLEELYLIGCGQITKAGHEHLKPLVPITESNVSGNLEHTGTTFRNSPNSLNDLNLFFMSIGDDHHEDDQARSLI